QNQVFLPRPEGADRRSIASEPDVVDPLNSVVPPGAIPLLWADFDASTQTRCASSLARKGKIDNCPVRPDCRQWRSSRSAELFRWIGTSLSRGQLPKFGIAVSRSGTYDG